MSSIIFIKIFFRFLGGVLLLLVPATFLFFGRQLVPLFEQTVSGHLDAFPIFLALSSFFLGIPSQFMIGFRMVFLRSFSNSWLTVLMFLVAAVVISQLSVHTIYDMDLMMSQTVTYIVIFSGLLYLLKLIHRDFYTPVSHEKMHSVGLINPKGRKVSLFSAAFIPIVLIALLFLHPASIVETLWMLFSPVMHLLYVLQ